eukprot:scaffold50805_cov31-Tisochrysis_lutea.AAC.8
MQRASNLKEVLVNNSILLVLSCAITVRALEVAEAKDILSVKQIFLNKQEMRIGRLLVCRAKFDMEGPEDLCATRGLEGKRLSMSIWVERIA